MPVPPLILPLAAIDHRLRRGGVFGIHPADVLRHVYVVGKTGAGKTALLENLVLAEIRAGHGVGVIDPHGDLAERLLCLLPRHRLNDVVFFDAGDTAYPVGINPLGETTSVARPLVASAVLSILRKTFADAWGPRTEHLLRNALLAALEHRDATLLTVLRLLTDARFRERVVDTLTDPIVRHFWLTEFGRYPPAFAAEVVAPVQNKLGALLSSPLLRVILVQPTSRLVPRAIMDGRRIFIANLSKGRVGEDASSILGAVLLSSFQLAAYARAGEPPGARVPFTLYVDEFPSFVTPSFAELLAEARKYGMALVLAHQHLGQLDEDLRRAVMGNVGTVITFRLGAEDAQTLAAEFLPALTAHDLTRLDRFQIALRLSVDGTTSEPFTAVTLPPEHIKSGRQAETIRRVSRERYGTPVSKVERYMREQLGES